MTDQSNIDEMKRAIADDVARRYGCDVSPDVVTIIHGYVHREDHEYIWSGNQLVPKTEAGRDYFRKSMRAVFNKGLDDAARKKSIEVRAKRAVDLTEKVIELAKSGKTSKQIAEGLGVSVKWVQTRAKAGGHPFKSVNDPVDSQKRTATILEMARSGKRASEIAEVMGLTRDRVRRCANANGFFWGKSGDMRRTSA